MYIHEISHIDSTAILCKRKKISYEMEKQSVNKYNQISVANYFKE